MRPATVQLSPSTSPPPTKCTISSLSPFAIEVSFKVARGAIAPIVFDGNLCGIEFQFPDEIGDVGGVRRAGLAIDDNGSGRAHACQITLNADDAS